MSTQGALMSSPSSSSTPQWTYDIFLNFRGEDTRKNFTDHLYDALVRKGISTFRDDEKLERGNTISKELLKAIEKSRFAIVIFSKNYASSKWCLDELVHIVRCMKQTGLKVMPVFYHVNPSDIRKQRGTFAQAFKEHKKRFGRSFLERLNKCRSKKMKKWRFALREVANISGWDLQDRNEAEFIQEIVGEMEKLSSKISSTTKNLVGIESSVQKLKSSYFGFKNNVGMIGIYGIGGLGKTTLARLVYDNFRSHFEGSSFIANVRKDSKNLGLHQLQQQLLADILEDKNIDINNVYDGVNMISKRLCCKKVLLVIDDVNQLDQLKNLAGEHSWFGLGSCIIITTRDERVLIQHGVDQLYQPNGLDSDDASKLFCLNAFKNEQPKEGYMKLSQDVVEYSNGLPLAIVTLGFFFVGRTIEEWQCALDGFKKTERKIFDVLKISYDGLDAQCLKDIFLNICFIRGKKKDQVIEILNSCGFNASYGITVLMEKSLLTVDDKEYLGMHDLLQEMGERIIRQESGENLGKQSRLWLNEDLLYVLENNMATGAIQAIVVTHRKKEDFNNEEFSEGFSKMSNLRLLIINDRVYRKRKLKGLSGRCHVPNDQRDLALPNNLRYLSWNRCPFKCLASSLKRMAFVQLHLPRSKFEYPWEGVMHAATLKFIDLSYSRNLVRTPDFSGVPMLEGLNLSACYNLVEIHPSIGQLSGFRYLYLRECGYLLSMFAEMRSLTVLDLSHSENLIRTPDFSGVPILEELDLSFCPQLVEIHPSIGQLSRLGYLCLHHCHNLTDLPSMSAVMQSLMVLDLSRCYKFSSFPKFTGIMKSLSTLNLSSTAIEKVEPSSIECLTALASLDLSHCTRLECLPSNMDNLKSLKRVKFSQCSKLNSLPRLPSNVSEIAAEGFSFLNWSPEGVKLSIWSQPLSQWLPFYESGNLVGFTKLFHFLRGLFFHKAVLGGYIIRSWSAVKEGFSINIKLPSNWYNSKCIGFALWASLPQLPCGVEVKDGIRARVIDPDGICSGHPTTYINGICLLYLSPKVWFGTVGNDECSQITVIFENRNDNSSYSSFDYSYFENDNSSSSPFDYSYFENDNSSSSSFENENSSYSTVHIWGECGVSLIYKQGVVHVDELNKTNAPCFIESFGELSIYKLTGGDDDVHIVDDDGVHIVDDDGVHKFRDDVHKFGDDDFDDDDI